DWTTSTIAAPYSTIYWGEERTPPEKQDRPAIEQAINQAVDEVRAIVRDWQPMKDKALALADDLGSRQLPVDAASRKEAQEFLRWAADNHFTFFGYREYRVE
ncbi:glutathione S-transferase family protein, partial [Pseudomonas syringae group genomosp. 7]|uniref:hypothetical protein n=1 Tax=Pseudomonas syringae group genomosp. 7 TaxID=251699 RepID=UPI00376FA6FF